MVRFPDVTPAGARQVALALVLGLSFASQVSELRAQAASERGWQPAAAVAQASMPLQSAPQGGWHYMVRSGDTLDRIISQTQAASPFSLAFLREAFARVNPSALPRGPQGPLIAGSLLRIPDSAELRRLAFPELEAPVRAPGDTASTTPPGSATPLTAAQREEIERRSWVRYP